MITAIEILIILIQLSIVLIWAYENYSYRKNNFTAKEKAIIMLLVDKIRQEGKPFSIYFKGRVIEHIDFSDYRLKEDDES